MTSEHVTHMTGHKHLIINHNMILLSANFHVDSHTYTYVYVHTCTKMNGKKLPTYSLIKISIITVITDILY